MAWLIWKSLQVFDWAEEKLADLGMWLHVKLNPDTRPSAELMAELKQRLSEMPAGQEIHEVIAILDDFEKLERSKAVDNA